jgi:ankyrin repeat protein
MRASFLTLVVVGWFGATAGCNSDKFCLRAFAGVSEEEGLVSAAELGNLKTLRRLLDAGISPESRKGQWSALSRAVLFGQVEAVEVLLDAGANINAPNPALGSAVYLAAAARHNTLLSRLLQRGADPNLTPDWGLTPLMVAAQQGNLSAVSILLEHAADPRRRNPAGRSALDLAREAGHTEAAHAIEEHLMKRGG